MYIIYIINKIDVIRELQHVEKGLNELSKTIEYAKENENDPKLKHLTEDEMKLRAKFIKKCRNKIKEIKKGMKDTSNLINRQNREKLLRLQNKAKEYRDEEDRTFDELVQKQKLQIKEQDECLGVLNDKLLSIDDLAHNIHDNLKEQHTLLGDLDDQVGVSQWSLETATGRIGRILQTQDKCQIKTVMCLCCIVVILFIILII